MIFIARNFVVLKIGLKIEEEAQPHDY